MNDRNAADRLPEVAGILEAAFAGDHHDGGCRLPILFADETPF